MGQPIVEHRQVGNLRHALAEFYGEAIPATAWLLEHSVTAGRISLRTPEGEVRTVNLRQAAAAFGGDLGESRCYLHHLHAAGLLTVEQDGTVELPATATAAVQCRPGKR